MPKHRFPYRPDILNQPYKPGTAKIRLPTPSGNINRLRKIERDAEKDRMAMGYAKKKKDALVIVTEALTMCVSIKRPSPEYRRMDKPLTIMRRCMCCKAEFDSEGIHNRLCPYCRQKGLLCYNIT